MTLTYNPTPKTPDNFASHFYEASALSQQSGKNISGNFGDIALTITPNTTQADAKAAIYLQKIRQKLGLPVNGIVVQPQAYTEHPLPTENQLIPGETPTIDAVKNAVKEAQKTGKIVVLTDEKHEIAVPALPSDEFSDIYAAVAKAYSHPVDDCKTPCHRSRLWSVMKQRFT